MRGVIVVIADIETGEICFMLVFHFSNHLLRRNTKLLRFQHDRCAVSVIGADEVNLIATHSLITHPNVRLDMLEHVTEMN